MLNQKKYYELKEVKKAFYLKEKEILKRKSDGLFYEIKSICPLFAHFHGFVIDKSENIKYNFESAAGDLALFREVE